ncbi:hypothetical protein EGW08_009620 [Elysia chlorotica]|uniref:Uncharacterized protein n=1 Tax=Elysia chlorotica TaxID=188477 RepID=A0A3S0ZMP5_ELYCH|nr:hypothetical protein EGW08_009620 [Elysia chlorotica]
MEGNGTGKLASFSARKPPGPPAPPATAGKPVGRGDEAKWEQLVKRLAIGWLHAAKVHQEPEAALGPAHAVVLLQQPRVNVYAAIARQLRKRDSSWLRIFLENHGLEILFETLEATRKSYSPVTLDSVDNTQELISVPADFSQQIESDCDSDISSTEGENSEVSAAFSSVLPKITVTPAANTVPASSSSQTRTQTSTSNSFFGVLLQVGCVECISLVMDSQQSLDYIIENDEFIKRFATGEWFQN